MIALSVLIGIYTIFHNVIAASDTANNVALLILMSVASFTMLYRFRHILY